MGSEVLAVRPLTGVGPGLAADYAYTANAVSGARSVDSYFLSLAVDSGIVSILLYALMLTYFIFVAARLAFSHAGPLHTVAGLLAVSLIALNLVAIVLSTNEIFTFQYIVFGIIVALWRHLRRPDILSYTMRRGIEAAGASF